MTLKEVFLKRNHFTKLLDPNKAAKSNYKKKYQCNFNQRCSQEIEKIDQKFNIITKDVEKILDIGYAPGNWMNYSQNKIHDLQRINAKSLSKKLYTLGVDILCTSPIRGVSTLQGNIFSKFIHEQIHDHFKNFYLISQNRANKKKMKAYENINTLNNIMSLKIMEQTFKNHEKQPSFEDYGPDLVLSDLSRPHNQESGFFNNLESMPYKRMCSNQFLNLFFLKLEKSNLQSAMCSFLLVSKLLKPNGSFLLSFKNSDYRSSIFKTVHSKLSLVFNEVTEYFNTIDEPYNYNSIDRFFICLQKKTNNQFNLNDIFFNK